MTENLTTTDIDWTERLATETGAAARVAAVIEPVIEDLGFRLVRVRITGEGGTVVQIFAEREDGTLTINDCVAVTRILSPVLDVEDPISGHYTLEVSSPGIDRPLVRPVDFVRYSGLEARVELSRPIEGQKRFRGLIEGFEDGEVRLIMDIKGFEEPQIIGLPFRAIHEAKLIMTDALLKTVARPKSKTKH
ncbi:Bacterial ribosome SSU maturation protein RimP [hydrothermal vent metagenome]|uniref:Bacterial ribosome SSU maturation protein RimP n=1 Tax=hydrothermal vent metagenome TaxID=652676 RepID=A0A3B0TF85_9ZZZZ